MQLELRAQAQWRATFETLSAIKNPLAVSARQAKIANGPQQVNNMQEQRVTMRGMRSRLIAAAFTPTQPAA